jgi:hypothetical protein
MTTISDTKNRSDRALLELAAKAAGLNLDWDSYTAMNLHRPMASYGETNWFAWNPLTDDGDALRLAVKLHMMVDCVRGADVIEIFVNGKIRHIGIDITDPDSYAATRRAIVRAAAAIGESM